MKIYIVTLAMQTEDHRQFYNVQDIGLGGALAEEGHEVEIFNFMNFDNAELVDHLSENLIVHYLPSKSIGSHSLNKYSFIKEGVDLVICFSDNQIQFKKLVEVCKKNKVPILPYVGVVKSNSSSRWKRILMNLFCNNIKTYRKMPVLAKTPAVAQELLDAGVKDVAVAPVGLDEHLLKTHFTSFLKEDLRSQMGIPEDAKILLYVARMTEEKNPLAVPEMLEQLVARDERFYLIAIGDGKLKDEFLNKIKEKADLNTHVTYMQKVPNDEMWNYYRAADLTINLNEHEIYGMAILESMYYGCPVVARRAPGPEYIITNKIDGRLCESQKVLTDAVYELLIQNPDRLKEMAEAANAKIKEQFMWNTTAVKILQTAEEKL